MTNQTGDHSPHDWLSREYVDEWVRKDPDRRPLYREVLALAALDPRASIQALDVGGGYGLFASVVLETFPNARVTVQDYSAPILDHARSYLNAYESRVAFIQSDLRDPEWAE